MHKRILTMLVVVAVAVTGFSFVSNPTDPAPTPVPSTALEEPDVTCTERHVVDGNEFVVDCEYGEAFRTWMTGLWLRRLIVIRAAAIYATAVAQAQQAVSGHPWLACIRARESGGNYSIYNTSGSGASGAYQFMPGTWAWMSAEAGYGAWSGGPAASAPPAVQDAVALWAYDSGYASHWGGC